jgi:hypothetical protein
MANRNAGIKSVKKPEFTDYTMAPPTEGSLALRKSFEAERHNIALRRSINATRPKEEPSARGGYPTKRERDDNIPSHRKVPFSGFTKRFKHMITFITEMGGRRRTTKTFILHATRGWKVYT